MQVRIPLPSRFSFDAVVRSHGWYDLPPFSYDQDRRVLAMAVAGRGGAASVRFRPVAGALSGESDRLSEREIHALAKRVFSLDVDLEDFARALPAGSPVLASLERGGGRMLRAASVFEDAVKILLTTNCSWEATKGMVTRLIDAAGDGVFPSPEAVASFSAARLKSKVRCGYRAVSLARFARRAASGALDLSLWESPRAAANEIRETILAEHGFGPYAAEGLLRILGRHDYLAIDSWVRKKFRSLHPGRARSTDGAIARRYAQYGRYRGLALWLEMTDDWHEELAPSLRS